MTGKVIDFKAAKEGKIETPTDPSTSPTEAPTEVSETPEVSPTQELLKNALERNFKDVILIGITDDSVSCMLTVDQEKAVYELSRAIYQLHVMDG